MRRTRCFLAGVTLLIAAACSSDDAAPTTSTAAPGTSATTTEVTTTTVPPTTTTTTPTSTTTLALQTESVGDPDALAALVDEVTEQVRIVYNDESVDVPVPDLTNPDPVVAARSINEFDQLTGGTLPFRDWARVMVYPGSPGEEALTESFDELLFSEGIRVRPAEPLVFVEGEVVDLASLQLPAETLEGMPEETIAVVYNSTSGPLLIVNRESGDVIRSLSEGWQDRPTVMLLVPTAAGWRAWDTLTDFGVSA